MKLRMRLVKSKHIEGWTVQRREFFFFWRDMIEACDYTAAENFYNILTREGGWNL